MHLFLKSTPCRDGGTGRRTGLKIQRLQKRAGSTPALGTKHPLHTNDEGVSLIASLIASLIVKENLLFPAMKNEIPPYKNARLVIPKNKEQRWYIVFYVWDATTGKLKRIRNYGVNKYKTVKEKKEFASLFIKKLNEKLRNGLHYNPSKTNKQKQKRTGFLSIKDAIQQAVQHKSERFGKRTKEAYKTVGNVFITWCEEKGLSDINITTFSEKDSIKFFDYLITRKITNKTYNNYIQFLKSLFNVLIERQCLETNPIQVKKLKTVDIGKNIAFMEEQIEQLKKELEASEPYLLFFCQFMFYSLMRPTEIRQIRLKHILLKEGKIHIPAENSKSKKAAYIQIHQELATQLKAANLSEFDNECHLFSSHERPSKKMLSKNFMTNKHRDILNKLGFGKEYTLYSWKHTAVIQAYKAGIKVKDIQFQLRHSSLEITDVYLKSLGLEENKEFIDKMPPKL